MSVIPHALGVPFNRREGLPPLSHELLTWLGGKTYEEVEIAKMTDKDKYKKDITVKSEE